MAQSSSSSGRPKRAKPSRKTAAKKGAIKKRPSTDISKTALGEEPEKRTRKSVASSKPSARKGQAKGGSGQGSGQGSGHRDLTVNVKTAKYRKTSSTVWLRRQLNDPYVAKAKAEGYRSRAAYKLIELDEKFNLLKSGARIVDLGCAPGGWCQVAVKNTGHRGQVVGIDYLSMDTVAGAEVLEMDFLDEEAPDRLKALLNGNAHVVLSDMAAPTTGHRATDHIRIVALAETALHFAMEVLEKNGAFVCKVLQGGAEGDLLNLLKQNFKTVRHAKPKSSRSDSAEMYVVALGFKGQQHLSGKNEA